MAHLTRTMVEQFFAREEENARGVLRKEMDSAMDTIFKQMKRKLMQLVESGPAANETGHGLVDLDGTMDRGQQLSNDTNHISYHISSAPTNSQAKLGVLNASNLSLQVGSDEQLSSSTNQIPSTSTDSFVPDNSNSNQNDEITVKNKLGESVNIITKPTSSTQSQPSNDNDNDGNLFDGLVDDEEDCDCSECMEGVSVNEEEGDDQEGDDDNDNSQSIVDLINESNDTSSRPTKRPRLENVQVQDQAQPNNQTNPTPTSTDSVGPDNANSNQNDEITVKNKLGELVNIITMPTSSTQSQPSNDNYNDGNLFDGLVDDEEDCYCSECMAGLSVNEEEGDQEGDDDNDNSQSIEDLINESNDVTSRPNKRPRLENVQVQDQAQPNNQTNPTQVITISLKCPQCSEMLEDKNKLNAHLEAVHSILKYRCLNKDCNRSFDKKMDLTGHYISAHSNQANTTWPCGYCSRHYKDSHSLFKHQSMYHEEGVFRCSYGECQFVAELKQTVLNHFWANHRQFVCQYPGCAKRYSCAAILKTHQRTHLNAKPYRCKLPKCKYGSAYKHHAIRHIRTHLKKLAKQKNGKNISDDPNDHLEVHEM